MKREIKKVDRYFIDTRKQLKTSSKIIKKNNRYIPEKIIGEEYFYYYVKWKDSDEINYESKKDVVKILLYVNYILNGYVM